MPGSTGTPTVRLVTGAFAASTALAVAVFIIARVSMAGAAAALVVLTGAAWSWVWRSAPTAVRAGVARRARAGAVGGAAGLVAYNLSRWLLVKIFRLELDPFLTIKLFGRLLLGAGRPAWQTLPAGIAFHVVNGIGLAVAFVVLFGPRGRLAGMAWAVLLEVVMVALYPRWLDIRKIDEFVTVTFGAHLAYGVVLADVARRRMGTVGGSA